MIRRTSAGPTRARAAERLEGPEGGATALAGLTRPNWWPVQRSERSGWTYDTPEFRASTTSMASPPSSGRTPRTAHFDPRSARATARADRLAERSLTDRSASPPPSGGGDDREAEQTQTQRQKTQTRTGDLVRLDVP